MPNTALNRTTAALLTNKSGGALVYGNVVILDNTNANGFTTTTSSGLATRQIGVILEPNGIANNASGMVATGGWVPKVILNTAATVGQFIKTHTVAGQATPHSSPQVEGDFGVALDASATPTAILFGSPNGPTTSSSSGTVQVVKAVTTAVATGTTTVPADDTIPQNTEGTEFLTVTITPTDATSVLYISSELMLSPSGAVGVVVALFQDTTANALSTSLSYVSTNNGFAMVPLMYAMTAGTTSATTFKLRAGAYSAATVTLNGQSGGRLFGGTASSYIQVVEVKP